MALTMTRYPAEAPDTATSTDGSTGVGALGPEPLQPLDRDEAVALAVAAILAPDD